MKASELFLILVSFSTIFYWVPGYCFSECVRVGFMRIKFNYSFNIRIEIHELK
jgi:hypothetical protein